MHTQEFILHLKEGVHDTIMLSCSKTCNPRAIFHHVEAQLAKVCPLHDTGNAIVRVLMAAGGEAVLPKPQVWCISEGRGYRSSSQSTVASGARTVNARADQLLVLQIQWDRKSAIQISGMNLKCDEAKQKFGAWLDLVRTRKYVEALSLCLDRHQAIF